MNEDIEAYNNQDTIIIRILCRVLDTLSPHLKWLQSNMEGALLSILNNLE